MSKPETIKKLLTGTFFLLFLCVSLRLFSQQQETDSLESVLKLNSLTDTARISTLIRLGYAYRPIDLGKAENVSAKAYALSVKTKSVQHKGKSLILLGVVHYYKGNLDLADSLMRAAEQIWSALQNRAEMARCYSLKGNILEYKGDYSNAIDMQMLALRIRDSLNLKADICSSCNRIGVLMHELGNDTASLRYYNRGLQLALETKSINLATSLYNNLANLHSAKGDNKKALELFDKGLELCRKYNNRNEEAMQLNNKGGIYFEMGRVEEALVHYTRALQIRREVGNKMGMVYSLQSIAEAQMAQGKYGEAEKNLREAISITQTVKSGKKLFDLYKSFSDCFFLQKKSDSAYHYHVLYAGLKDSIQSGKLGEKISELEAKYENEKKSKEIAEKEAEIERKNEQQILFVGLIALAVVLAVFAFVAYAVKRKNNHLIFLQKQEAVRQKEIADVKNKEITDSINYAQRIQQALLPDVAQFESSFKDAFVLFRPKAIVSGDFFWLSEKGGFLFYATVDCTGHGVPGGFMSMLGISLLNEIVNEKNIVQPAEVLNQMRAGIVNSLRQKGEFGESKDGMDMTLCRLNKEQRELVYAAANNPVWIIQSGVMREFAPDKQPVGIGHEAEKPFHQHSIQLTEGDRIYTFTDGYADQFGGPKGKKFKYRQLNYHLLLNASRPMKDQRRLMDRAFDEWRGNLEQIDDVCLIGVRV